MSAPTDPLAAAIQELKQVVEKLRDDLVRKDVYVVERDALREDVSEIKDTMRWLSRALVTSLLLPLISTVIVIYVIQQGAK